MVSVLKAFPPREKDTVAVYVIPEPNDLPNEKDRDYLVPNVGNITQIDFLGSPATQDGHSVEGNTILYFVIGVYEVAFSPVTSIESLHVTLLPGNTNCSYTCTKSGFEGPFVIGRHQLRLFVYPMFGKTLGPDISLCLLSIKAEGDGSYSLEGPNRLRIPQSVGFENCFWLALDELLGRVYVFTKPQELWRLHIVSYI